MAMNYQCYQDHIALGINVMKIYSLGIVQLIMMAMIRAKIPFFLTVPLLQGLESEFV